MGRLAGQRRGLLAGIVIGFSGALVLAVAVALLPGFLGAAGSSDDRSIRIRGEHIAVELRVPADIAIDEVVVAADANLECRVIRYDFDRDLTLEAFEPACQVDPDQQTINGRHGVYRTLDDVPEPVDVTEVETPAGPAVVFLQRYAEYTNERNAWDEPVAIITLDDPVDPDFPTVVLRSNKATLDREAFTEVVTSLASLEYAPE